MEVRKTSRLQKLRTNAFSLGLLCGQKEIDFVKKEKSFHN